MPPTQQESMPDANDHIILKDYSAFDDGNKIVGADKRFPNPTIEMVENKLKK